MAVDKFFTLTNSNTSLSKKFQVLQSGYKPILEKSQTIDKTLDGNLDVSMGGLYQRYEFLVRVREEETRSNYGNIEDLKTFYSYNSPNEIPSNVITMITNTGEEVSVYMTGQFSEQFLGVMIEGENSWALVQCVFQCLSAAQIQLHNDEFDTPVVITSHFSTYTRDTTTATSAADDPTLPCAGNKGSRSVWYSFTPATNGRITITTATTTYDTVLAIWTGARGSLVNVACNDDATYGIQSELRDISITGGVTHFIEVVGYGLSSPGGTLNLFVQFVPS